MPFRPEEYTNPHKKESENVPDPGLCKDGHEECQLWAQKGECKKNAGFMKSTCLEACGVCEPCSSINLPCYARNRASLGYLVGTEEDELS
jgi:hypothetical protein